MFRLTFLGTSAGIPTKQRNVTALAVECLNTHLAGDKKNSKHNRPWVLIDCGEGTQHQLLRTKLSGHQLAAICITHVHGDHCYGLPGLLASLAMSNRKAPLTIIAPKAIATLLDTLSLTTELYFTYPIEFIAIEALLSGTSQSGRIKGGKVVFDFGSSQQSSHQLSIDIVALSHRVPSHAFILEQILSFNKLDTEKLRREGIAAGKTWGLLQSGRDVILDNDSLNNDTVLLAADYLVPQHCTTKMIVAGDNDSPERLTKAASDATILIHEATYTDAVLAKIDAGVESDTDGAAVDPMHSSAGQVARFAQQVQLPNLILTHFSARYQSYDDPTATTPNMADIRLEVEQYYQGNCWLAEDFAQFEVGDSVTRVISD